MEVALVCSRYEVIGGLLSSTPLVGFFVSRHLGLLLCNIAIMKRFLPLFILTGLLFGQDVLTLKNGESFEGTFLKKLGRDIIFTAEGDTTTKKFQIWDIETIETMNWGELTYPFDIPTKQEYPFDKEGNERARIAMQFLFNPNPTPLQFCGGVIAWGIVFIILLALNPGSDS